MKINLFAKLIFAVFLAFTVNSFIFFSFGNIYSSRILNYANFQAQFHSGIYQYRILSGYFLLWIYEFLSGLTINYDVFKFKFLDPDSEPKMYLSFYLLNTFFLILSAVFMVLIADIKNFIATSSERIMFVVISIFTIGLTQFVVVPYDISSYFFLLVFIYFLLKYLEKSSKFYLTLLMITMLISTLNRESSALSLSLSATLLYFKFGLKKGMILPISILTGIFILVYLGIRLSSETFNTNDGNLFAQNFYQPKNILGLLFWLTFFALTLILAQNKNGIRPILVFHLFSIPYIFMCFYTGIIYEIRLYVPLFLTSIFLGRISLSRIQ